MGTKRTGAWTQRSSRFLIAANHCEPSICRSTHLRSTIMAKSLLHTGSGMTTGSYPAAGIERFNASSSSLRALVNFARTFASTFVAQHQSSFWGKKGYELLHDGSRFGRCHSVRRVTVFQQV